MRLPAPPRPAAIAFTACSFALVALSSGVDPGTGRQAGAQTAPTSTVGAVDPAAAGLVPASPAPPAAPANATEVVPPEEGGSLTASLGGSDVAVSSPGGSYEVDGPKRKAKKWPRTAPTP